MANVNEVMGGISRPTQRARERENDRERGGGVGDSFHCPFMPIVLCTEENLQLNNKCLPGERSDLATELGNDVVCQMNDVTFSAIIGH